MLPRSLVTALTVLVTLAWSVNVVYGFIDPARHDPTLNAIFGVVVGGVYALGRGHNRRHMSKLRAELGRVITGEPGPADDADDDPSEVAERAHDPRAEP